MERNLDLNHPDITIAGCGKGEAHDARRCQLHPAGDREVEEVYYFRWWSFRKHLKKTTNGFVFTEFLVPLRHAGQHNPISCAAGHHLAEGDGYTMSVISTITFASGSAVTAASRSRTFTNSAVGSRRRFGSTSACAWIEGIN